MGDLLKTHGVFRRFLEGRAACIFLLSLGRPWASLRPMTQNRPPLAKPFSLRGKCLLSCLLALALSTAPASSVFAQESSTSGAESEKFDANAPYYLQGLDKGLVYGAAVTGGVALGLGILFTGLSFGAAGRASDINDEILASPAPGCMLNAISPSTGQAVSTQITSGKCGELQTALEDRDAYRVGAIVGFLTAGAALIAIGGYAFIGSSDQKQDALVVAPVVGPSFSGLSFQGRF